MSELKMNGVGIYTCETTGVSELSWDEEGICVDLGNDIDKESANTIYNCIKEHEATKPIPCKSWVKDYYFGNQPSYQAKMWKEIDDYIKEMENTDGWTLCSVEQEKLMLIQTLGMIVRNLQLSIRSMRW